MLGRGFGAREPDRRLSPARQRGLPEPAARRCRADRSSPLGQAGINPPAAPPRAPARRGWGPRPALPAVEHVGARDPDVADADHVVPPGRTRQWFQRLSTADWLAGRRSPAHHCTFRSEIDDVADGEATGLRAGWTPPGTARVRNSLARARAPRSAGSRRPPSHAPRLTCRPSARLATRGRRSRARR